MSEIPSSVYVAFGTQTGTDINDALDANPATLTVDLTPGADSEPAGLVLGDGTVGIDGSGLSFGRERVFEPKAVLAGSLGTRPLSDYLRIDPSTFTFAFPLCGNRGNASTPAVDADFVPNSGIQAILNAFRLTGSAWGSGVGQIWVPDTSAKLATAVIGLHGVRFKVKDIRGRSLSIVLDPGGRPIATAQFEGTISERTVASAPTLDYGVLASESPPVVGTPAAAHLFGASRSLNACTLQIAPNIARIGDSEADAGIRKSIDDLAVTASCRAWADDANADFDDDQMEATSSGTLTEFSMQVGAAAGNGEVMKAIKVRMPTPEVVSSDGDVLDKKGASAYELRAAGATANSEFELIFL